MFLEIITPDKKVFEGEVKSVLVPGSKGQFQMLENQAAFISTLVSGKVKIKKAGELAVLEHPVVAKQVGMNGAARKAAVSR